MRTFQYGVVSALLCLSAAAAQQSDEKYLVHHHLIHNTGFMEGRFRFGSTGAWGWVNGDRMIVRGVMPRTPADGKLLMHDIITGVNGRPFAEGKDPRPALANAITESETREKRGVMTLSVVRQARPMTVRLTLRVMGTYSETWPFNWR